VERSRRATHTLFLRCTVLPLLLSLLLLLLLLLADTGTLALCLA